MAATIRSSSQIIRDMLINVGHIRTAVEEYDIEKTRKDTKILRVLGQQVMSTLTTDKNPSQYDIVSPVAIKLGEIISSPLIQHNRFLLTSLCKTYRIFVEVMWMQCAMRARKDQIECCTYTESIDKIRDDIRKIKGVIPGRLVVENKKIVSGAGMLLDLNCIEQGIQFFHPSKPVWPKYVSHAFKTGESVWNLNPFSILTALKDTLKDLKKDVRWVSKWYCDVLYLKLQAAKVKTLEDYQKEIQPKIEDYLMKGKRQSSCLPFCFMTVIKNEKATKAAKDQAFLDLLNLLSRETNLSLFEKVKKGVLQSCLKVKHKVDKGCDPFWVRRKADPLWAAREVTIQYLFNKFMNPQKKEKYGEYSDKSKDAFEKWRAIQQKEPWASVIIKYYKEIFDDASKKAKTQREEIAAEIFSLGTTRDKHVAEVPDLMKQKENEMIKNQKEEKMRELRQEENILTSVIQSLELMTIIGKEEIEQLLSLRDKTASE